MLKLPKKHKMEVAWECLSKVLNKISSLKYLVNLNSEEGQCKMFHANMLKPYCDRGNLVFMVRGGQKKRKLH